MVNLLATENESQIAMRKSLNCLGDYQERMERELGLDIAFARPCPLTLIDGQSCRYGDDDSCICESDLLDRTHIWMDCEGRYVLTFEPNVEGRRLAELRNLLEDVEECGFSIELRCGLWSDSTILVILREDVET